jgi:hypothetical protein
VVENKIGGPATDGTLWKAVSLVFVCPCSTASSLRHSIGSDAAQGPDWNMETGWPRQFVARTSGDRYTPAGKSRRVVVFVTARTAIVSNSLGRKSQTSREA